MISKEMFAPIDPSLVELRTGPHNVWYYLGNDLRECTRFARIVLENGGTFFDPLTGKPYGSNIEQMDVHKAELLLAIYHLRLYKDKASLLYSEEFPHLSDKYARGFTTNYSYLVHFGLLSKARLDGKVYYRLTNKGMDFCRGFAQCPKFVVNRGAEVLAVSPESYTMGDLIPNFQTRTPMWWEAAA